MVSILTYFSDDPSSNPADSGVFIAVKLFEKNKDKLKRGRHWPERKYIFIKICSQCATSANLLKPFPHHVTKCNHISLFYFANLVIK